jgi:hypothetical protein
VNFGEIIVEALGRFPCRNVGCKELKGRLTGLLDKLHGVMRRFRQIGRIETGGNTLGLRSPEHGIRHATQSALLMTWDWRGKTSLDADNTNVGEEWRRLSQLLDGRCRWFGGRVVPMTGVFPCRFTCDFEYLNMNDEYFATMVT